MTKITRIGDILNGQQVEREDDALRWMHDVWKVASAIESPKVIPVEQWVIDAFDDARREVDLPADKPMDPMTAGDFPIRDAALCKLMEAAVEDAGLILHKPRYSDWPARTADGSYLFVVTSPTRDYGGEIVISQEEAAQAADLSALVRCRVDIAAHHVLKAADRYVQAWSFR